MRRAWRAAVLAALVAFPAGNLAAQTAAPSTTDDVERLRAELAALRAEYAARIAELEARLDALTAAQAAPPAPSTEPTPQPAVGAAAAAPSSKVFNPDIAVIGDFLGAAGKDPGPEPAPSLELHEAEASFQAIVDPYARADFFLAFSGGEVEIEEGFVSFPSLPGGLLLKAGKMRGAFGKVNVTHNHAMPWADRPLVTRKWDDCMLEAQDFYDGDRALSATCYVMNRSRMPGAKPIAQAQVHSIDTTSGAMTHIPTPIELYAEAEGIFPSGRHTTVECGNDQAKGLDICILEMKPVRPAYTRITFAQDYGAYRFSNPQISRDGRRMVFQIGLAAEEAGSGRGLLLMDLPPGL